MAIPRKIHYCWFGGGEKPELVQKCIASWRRFCPDCEIIEWNPANYDVTKNAYMHQAYQARRWGFATDYARLDIVYTHGGIYLDTDVELIKSIDELFETDGFIGFERGGRASQQMVNTGQGFGAPARHEIIKKLLEVYEGAEFIHADGTQNLTTCPYYNTQVLKAEGLKCDGTKQVVGGLSVYPAEYLCPIDWLTKECTITENTFSIHHFNASWASAKEKRKRRLMRRLDYVVHLPNMLLKKALGDESYDKLKRKLRGRRDTDE
ncbi:MAG: glycosyl transferase [Clostridia bacterium]|nr:glycosyl transferase [Clostridia bacterium]